MRTVLRFLAVSAIAAVLVVVSAALMATQARTLSRAAHVESIPIDLDPLSQRSVVLARDGSLLAVLHAEENRLPIALDEVPRHVIDIVLAVEDEDFYHHEGINLRATVRALFANVQAGDIRQGGSTITQQLVKNALLTPEQDLDRKVKEAVLAVRLEQQLDKDEILERYLNTVYLGNGTYGLQAAAELYWGTSAGELTTEQAALLAGMIRNPIGYDPFLQPEAALDRRDWVIDRLARIGTITTDEAALLKTVPLPDAAHRTLARPQDHFVEEVTRLLIADRRLGETPTERYNAVFRGGLTITTTLDPRLQLLGIAAVQSVLPDTDGQFTAALVSVEPGSGAVRALYGGPEFDSQQYNLATQGLRQPGSSFKPFVLAAHLEDGGSANDTVSGAGPCRFTPRQSDLLIEDWRVQNFGNSRGRSGTVASSMQASLNCAFARLALIVGPEKVVEVARKLGITSPLIGVPAISLGAEEVHPIEMAAAFAAFAADGIHHAPYFVEEVRDRDGTLLFRGRSEPVRAVSVQTARVMNQVLRGVIDRGTGTRARLQGHQAAGKTGTAQNHEDAWFVGYTPRLSTAVWMGAPDSKVPMRNVGGIRVTGGSYPAMMWRALMQPAHDDWEPISFAAPGERTGRGTSLRIEGERAPVTSRAPVRRAPATTTPTTSPGSDVGGPGEEDGGDRGGDGHDGGDGGTDGDGSDRDGDPGGPAGGGDGSGGGGSDGGGGDTSGDPEPTDSSGAGSGDNSGADGDT